MQYLQCYICWLTLQVCAKKVRLKLTILSLIKVYKTWKKNHCNKSNVDGLPSYCRVYLCWGEASFMLRLSWRVKDGNTCKPGMCAHISAHCVHILCARRNLQNNFTSLSSQQQTVKARLKTLLKRKQNSKSELKIYIVKYFIFCYIIGCSHVA